jgi:ATP-dependent DNA helicase RecG
VSGPARRSPRRPGPGSRPAVALDPVELLRTPIGDSGLPGAPTLRRAGARLGIATVRDLLFHLPRRYDDLRELRLIGDLTWVADGTPVSVRAAVREVRVEPTFRGRVQRTVARLDDGTGTIEAVWFGRRFIERRLHAGDAIVLSGRLRSFRGRLTIDAPDFQPDDGSALLHAGRIVPVYRLTAGLTATRLRVAIRAAIDRAARAYPEYLPPALLGAERLPGIGEAIEAAHFPDGFERRDAALDRLAFDELLALQVGMVGRRRARGRAATVAIPSDDATDARVRATIVAALGRRLGRAVGLTDDQAAAMAAVRADIAKTTPMLRLVQGDVGSGKTAVAAHALALAALAGRQGALLAPTDLLARQHAVTLGDLLADLGIGVTLLTGSLSAAGRRAAGEGIADGRASVVVGTHALLQESVAFADLGLAVIDEQHRFGVEQRGLLEAKAGDADPHVLLMTATPIPRTLGQVLYADLDVSDLRAAPSGRVAIRTAIRHPADQERLWDFVIEEGRAGRRTFVVVPLIEPDLAADEDAEGVDPIEAGAVAAEAEAVRLRARLADLRVGLVHGRMRPADRDAEMARFRDGDLEVLVGTTVVEVGVDVPEATVMVVESADRFGLAQLHQLRGRVGRGTDRSYCVLVSDAAPSTAAWEAIVGGDRAAETTAQARLVTIARTLDGFELAEADFALRREGDVLGLAQSGLPALRVASLQREAHRALAVRARAHAERLVADDGSLAPGHDALDAELRSGWLARVFAGDPASGA